MKLGTICKIIIKTDWIDLVFISVLSFILTIFLNKSYLKKQILFKDIFNFCLVLFVISLFSILIKLTTSL